MSDNRALLATLELIRSKLKDEPGGPYYPYAPPTGSTRAEPESADPRRLQVELRPAGETTPPQDLVALLEINHDLGILSEQLQVYDDADAVRVDLYPPSLLRDELLRLTTQIIEVGGKHVLRRRHIRSAYGWCSLVWIAACVLTVVFIESSLDMIAAGIHPGAIIVSVTGVIVIPVVLWMWSARDCSAQYEEILQLTGQAAGIQHTLHTEEYGPPVTSTDSIRTIRQLAGLAESTHTRLESFLRVVPAVASVDVPAADAETPPPVATRIGVRYTWE